ncbi:MAG: 16S rRNA (adenine(1518)-N(6)/adenine(1519)-N(6))-dimethyltransferase RsmA [Peptococcaceae bacterium]|jgi:16S rRNA (adenine1518-N6/adenine1519-N6)-dimethyltransferase|nr:16S rRNA (adenine(1518)-N(6)/adenine(1519)-N(6))-dimethyltransferase RsmA [Peptococcaceae bacterium]
MENALNYTRRLMKAGAKARKSLGQNFLIDDEVIAAIVKLSGVAAEIPAVEIGPGLGVLTRLLAGQTGRLWAVELDQNLLALLRRELRSAPVEWVQGDALKLHVRDLWGEQKGILIGNLPYYITSPLLEHYLQQADHLLSMTIMVQQEVARRMVAEPGGKDYGVLSIAVQTAAEPELALAVPRAAFLPSPQVDSAVVRLRLRPFPGLSADQGMFFRLVKAAFGQRRKTVLNSLSAGLGRVKGEVEEMLTQAGIDGGRRAETISIAEYIRLTEVERSR